ncbi:MAG TPA: multidrug efflux SMR transporter [Nocardioidaceae bacterium]|nr:multidrug efflux SMR transporter [Nocardioidaceae bacterium]
MIGAFLLLLLAIATEVAATASLPRAEGFRNPLWTAVVLGGYALSIWLLALVVRTMPVSVAYAIWSGIGTAAIAVIGVMYLGERIDLLKAAAIAMIVVGVVVLNLHHTS